jgi:hypothetical protein
MVGIHVHEALAVIDHSKESGLVRRFGRTENTVDRSVMPVGGEILREFSVVIIEYYKYVVKIADNAVVVKNVDNADYQKKNHGAGDHGGEYYSFT